MNTEILFLRQLVAIPTVTDDILENDKALDYLQNFFTTRGLFCLRKRFDGHDTLIASSRRDNAKTPTILLAAHIDVVSGTKEGLTLVEKEGNLIGRGVYDMKFSIAGYMGLVEALGDSVDRYDFAIMITTDEELGGKDGVNGVEKLVREGYRPKVCILPDSAASGWDIEKLAKGVWRFDLIANGKQGHGSRPWEGESASFKLIPALEEIKTHFVDQGPMTDTLNIAMLHGGETYNLLPSLMTAGLEVRYMSNESHAVRESLIENVCRKYGLEYRERALLAPVTTNLEDPFVRAYANSVKRVTSRYPKGIVSFASSDAPYFVRQGIPCIVSSCLGGRHHSPDEWINKESFLQFVPILQDFFNKIALTTSDN